MLCQWKIMHSVNKEVKDNLIGSLVKVSNIMCHETLLVVISVYRSGHMTGHNW